MKKRIIIYGVNYYPPRGGTSRVVENLILQLKDSFDITIYCYKNQFAKQHIEGVQAIEFTPLASGSLGSLLYFLLSAIHILFKGNADLIHAHKTDCAVFIPLLRLRYKVIATSHEAPYKRDKWNFIQKSYFHLAEKIFIKSASVCTCISKSLSEYYHIKYKKDVKFIPNGINLLRDDELDFEKAASLIPAAASIYKPFLLFSARRLMATKGCHTMLEALKKINYAGQIFIAGELEESSVYLQRLRTLAIGLNVFFLGYVDPLPALLALVKSSEIFVFPSETEGMSVMLLEVASAGIPIVASDIPENQQIFSDQHVLYFACGDADDLARKIAFALSHKSEMTLLGSEAEVFVNRHYLWSSIATEYSKIYSEN